MFSRLVCLLTCAGLTLVSTGCVSKSRFTALETQAQVLGEQNRALLAENENYKQRLRQLTGAAAPLPDARAGDPVQAAGGWVQAPDADPAYTR